MRKENIATYKIEDLSEGQQFSFLATITRREVDNFAVFSGDISPLHMDGKFACSRGFRGRVVHGALLISYLSKLVGVYFPGENCLLQSLSLKFLLPAYIDDTIEIGAVIEQISLSTSVILLSITIKNAKNHAILVKGKIQVGFTKTGNHK